jgi:predicted AlkP superfamily pyrophosphatase or phosphodiesterase
MQNDKTPSHKLPLLLLILGLFVVSIIVGVFIYKTQRDEKPPEGSLKVAQPVEKEKQKLIVLTSLDGFGSNLLNETDAPYIYSLLENSSYTLDATTSKLSVTLISHTSMLTGLNDESHGVTYNSVDANTPPFTLPTIFDYTIEADYDYYSFATKEKLLHLLGEKSVDNIKYMGEMADTVVDDIDQLVEPGSENVFAFIHFRDLDSIGHQSGWGSDEQMAAFTLLDENVEEMIADLDEEFTDYERYYIITADHGGEGKQHGNGCPDCRRIPIIVHSENTDIPYKLDSEIHNYKIYDLTCVVLDIMNFTPDEKLDCYRKI